MPALPSVEGMTPPAQPRILDLDRDRLAALRGRALTRAVAAAEGRTMVAEVFAERAALSPHPDGSGVHNAELVAAFGADVVVLNLIERAWDGERLRLPGLGEFTSFTEPARVIGRPVGVNLEPGDVPEIRRAEPEYAKRLVDMGAALLCITANPGTGGSYEAWPGSPTSCAGGWATTRPCGRGRCTTPGTRSGSPPRG